MPTAGPADDAAIREQAYYFWEEDGRPPGRETEYWMRATIAVAEKVQLDRLTRPAPKKAKAPTSAKSVKAEAKPKPKLAVKPSLKAAASKSKAAPAKAEPAKKPKKK